MNPVPAALTPQLAADRVDFCALLDACADSVAIHDATNKNILWANRAATDAYGYSLEELLALDYSEIAPADKTRTREAVNGEVDQALFKDHHTFEWVIRCKSGEEIPIEATATYVPWGATRAIMVQFRDITDRKRTEMRLKRHELRFREFMQDLAEGVCIVSSDGRIEYLSPSADRLLGYEKHSILGRRFHDLLDARTERQILARFARRTPDIRSMRYRVRHADGSWRWHEATYRYVELEDDLSGFLLHFRDITANVAADKAAREQEKMLEYLARHNAMGEMAAAIAHELSQPLVAAQNYIEGGARRIPKDLPGREELEWGLEHARLQIDRATEIIRSVREYAVKHELTREVIDLNDVLNEVRYFIELRARQMSVRVAWGVSDLPLSIRCERVLIGQVIINLAFNAIEAMAEVSAMRRLLRISSHLDGNDVLVRVEDRGRGLPIGREQKMFDGFFSTKKGGNGIGLSLCQNIISKHGGTIWAERGQQAGAVFLIKLPLKRDPT
jgi:PAS domain S-box-containing protein